MIFTVLKPVSYTHLGSVGAAKGAGIGAGIYKDNNEAFATLEKLNIIEPNAVSYTHLDVYKRQVLMNEKGEEVKE